MEIIYTSLNFEEMIVGFAAADAGAIICVKVILENKAGVSPPIHPP